MKASLHVAGRDARGHFVASGDRLSARNVSLKDLIVEAYHVEPFQVSGPGWFDSSEYDIDAKADAPAGREQLRLMLRALLTERFQLALHRESKETRVFSLVVDKNGPKIHPAKEGEPTTGGFHGEMRQLANLISVQLTIPPISDPSRPSMASGPPVPVVDKTGLSGTYDFPIDFGANPEADMLQHWQRILQDKLGLKLESQRSPVEFLVVDSAAKLPTAN